MGKKNTFQISFSNPDGVYYSGSQVQGCVVLEINTELKLKGIRLHFYGGCDVRWTESNSSGTGKNRKTETKHHTATETYFNYELVLTGQPTTKLNQQYFYSSHDVGDIANLALRKASGALGDYATLVVGNYTYPYQFRLPPDVPSSFEGDIGRVRYTLVCNVDTSRNLTYTMQKAFTVINPLDLNSIPGTMDGVRGEGRKTLCCLCCKSGPISCRFQLDRCGYVPGEFIPINAEIINHSSRKMKRSFVELYMVVVHHATKKSRTRTEKVAELSRGEILPGDTDSWGGVFLRIPPLPPTSLPGCGIIDIDYFIKLCVEPTGPAFDLEIGLRMIIGTLPLDSVLQQYGYPTTPRRQTRQPQEAWRVATPLPPMCYGESVLGTITLEDETSDSKGVQCHRVPMYTFYNWPDPTSQGVETTVTSTSRAATSRT